MKAWTFVLGLLLLAGLSVSSACAQEGGLALPQAPLITFQDCPDCPRMVRLPSGLAMGQAQVTRGEFARFAAETGFQQSGWGCVWPQPGIDQTDKHPVVCVSWNDAQKYVAWLSKKAGHPYRLPKLQEMQDAALAGETTAYWWGQDIGQGRAACNGCGGPRPRSTVPVESFKPNAYGLYDAVGNVWQWTDSCHDENCTDHFLIGGSWANVPADLRTSHRIWNEPNGRSTTYGIRVVRDVQ